MTDFLKPPIVSINVSVYGNQAGYDALQKAMLTHQSAHFELVRSDKNEGYAIQIAHPHIQYFSKVSVLDKAGNLLTPKAGTYHLVADQQSMYLLDENNRVVQGIKSYYDSNQVQGLLKILDNISKWEQVRGLKNTPTQLAPDQIDFAYYDAQGNILEGEEIITHFRKVDGEWQGTEFDLRVSNHTDQGLYFSLIYLDENYEVALLTSQYFEANTHHATILETQKTWLESYNEEENKIAYHEGLDEYFSNESTMTFKLLVSTQRLDGSVLEQAPIDIGYVHSGNANSLKNTDQTFTLFEQESNWFTKTITIHTIRQRAKLGTGEVKLVDNDKLIIKGNSYLSADLKLSTPNPGSRSASYMDVLPVILEKQTGTIVDFGGSPRGNHILEFNNIQGNEALANHPLKIMLRESIDEDELLLPLTYDGAQLLTVGEVDTDAEGHTLITINALPEQEEDHRSLGKSLKLAFFKIALKRHPDKLYQLAWVEYLNAPTKNGRTQIKRHKDNDDITEKVKSANKVLLLIHGIIGDTEEMAIGVKDMIADKGYDLVLSFDYENLNSSIRDDISWSLKDQLDRVGFKKEDGKELHVLAQGMGCLVARWMVEQRKGHELVDRMILVGPPNQGSVLGNIETARKFATIALGLTLNILSPLAAWAGGLLKTIKNIMKQSKQLTTTLAEMQEGSSFIRDLNNSDDSGIPYLVLAGDVRNYEPTEGSNFSKFKEQMYKSVGTFVNAGEANDMIVDFTSMKSLGKNTQVEVTQVACHHLNYFEEEVSLKAIQEML
ncbi:esterase/lipase family protein [Microscilla marina]|uniref:DUF7379 domain-containing protein n=1 Tax=Microscilla marina ATCC 23134 TaxID=313606 RepID=A1ZEX3_MICM2|nr:hypothetical protein [Microscilla marina]EAY31075.1 hypothetical protein M23134_07483 [Microscilla marina ATCC 23134]